MTKLLQQCFLFFIVVVIPGHNLGNSQVSVNRTIGPTLFFFLSAVQTFVCSLQFTFQMNVCIRYFTFRERSGPAACANRNFRPGMMCCLHHVVSFAISSLCFVCSRESDFGVVFYISYVVFTGNRYPCM